MWSTAGQRAVASPAGTTVYNRPLSQQRGNTHNWNSLNDEHCKPTYKHYKLSVEFKYINMCVSHALVVIVVLWEVNSEAYKQLKLEHIRHITQNSRTRWMQSNG
jgi:hypothetical protein